MINQIKEWFLRNKVLVVLFLAGLILGYWWGGKDSIVPLVTSRLNQTTPDLIRPLSGAAAPVAPESLVTTENKNSGSPDSRLIIKTGVLSLLVKEVRASVSQIGGLAETLGGYVSSSAVSIIDEAKNKLTATIVIRVPAEKYNQSFEQIKNIAVKTTSESSTGEDVTQQYTDLDSRLKNLEGAETQLLEIMKNAKETKDVLSVFTELTNIRGQIETTKGQMQYLERSGKLATITVYLATEESELPIVEGPWTPMKALRQGLRDLVGFLQNAADAGIYWLIFASPLVGGVLIFAIWRLIKKLPQRQSS